MGIVSHKVEVVQNIRLLGHYLLADNVIDRTENHRPVSSVPLDTTAFEDSVGHSLNAELRLSGFFGT